MSTSEEFKNAPVGSTATSPYGHIAFKTARPKFEWFTFDSHGDYIDSFNSADMEDFTLNTAAPTSAREALDLAWGLAHEVKEGQTISEGTRYLEFLNSELREYTAPISLDISPALVPKVRTHEPLPDSKPDWANAPAVMAFVKGRVGDPQVFSRENETGTQWLRDTKVYHWYELMDVTPLYPKEDS